MIDVMGDTDSGADRHRLASYLDTADIDDPVSHADAAALMDTAKGAGYITDWQPHPGTGASFVPSTVTLTNQHLYAVSLDDRQWRPVSGDLIVTMIRGLLEGNDRADIDVLKASIRDRD